MKKVYTRIIAIGMIALPFCAKAQVTQASNAPTLPNPYVGLAGSENYALQIRHNGNHPINFFTNNALRMKLNFNVSYDINGATGTNMSREGYLLLGQDNNFNNTSNPIYNTGAFSLLHLNGYNSTGVDELGYRNWMQTGITLTGNHDLLRSLEC